MIADPHDNVLFCSDFYDLPYHSQHVQGTLSDNLSYGDYCILETRK